MKLSFLTLLLSLVTVSAQVSWQSMHVYPAASTGPVDYTAITNGLGYAPANKAGDTFSGTVVAPSYYTSFDYTQFPGLYIAVSADTLTNSYAIGAAVTNWTGQGITLTSDSVNGPKLLLGSTGLPALRYAATNYMKFAAAAPMNTNFTLFLAFEANGNLSAGDKTIIGGSPSSLPWNSANVAMYGFGVAAPLPVTDPGRYVGYYNFKYNDGDWPYWVFAGMNGAIVSDMSETGTWNWFGTYSYGALGSGVGTHLTDGSGFTGNIYEFVVYTNALSQDQAVAIMSRLRAKYRAIDPPYLFMDGDMGFIGGGMSPSEKGVSPVYRQLDNITLSHNGALNASTVRTLDSIGDAATNLTSGALSKVTFPGAPDQVYNLYYGTRDLLTTNAAWLWPITSNCMAVARSQGWTVPAYTLLPAGGTNDAERLAYNNLVRQYWPNCASVLVDLQTLSFTSPTDYTNSTYYVNDTGNGYQPQPLMSRGVLEFLLRKLRPLCSTNLIAK